MNNLTQQGMAFLRSGDKLRARQVLKSATQADPRDLTAWIWLAAALDDRDESIACLEQALTIDPNNLSAKKGLARLRANPRPAAKEPDSQPFSIYPIDQVSATDFPAWMPREAVPVQPNTPGPSETSEKQPAHKKIDTQPLPPLVGTPVVHSKPAPPKKQNFPWVGLAIGGIALLAIISCVLAWMIAQSLLAPASTQPKINPPVALVAASSTPSPTKTSLPSPTITPTETPKPTKTPTPTPTFPILGATIEAQMDRIQKEVSDLRGLPINTQVPRFIVSPPTAKQYLINETVTDVFLEELNNELRVLSILGLVKPTYDLVNASINNIIDGIGGFYEPDTKKIFILGVGFKGMEHFVFSHEFNHALVDMNFSLAAIGAGLDCPHTWDRCQAIDALIEGDATLTMYQWLEQYAGPQDYRELMNYRPPAYALPEQFPPPYSSQNAYFPYDYGSRFVKTLYDRGRWAEVNKAYGKLPLSTEHILHPSKYQAYETPLELSAPDLKPALGEGWNQIENSSMGEWMTYLLLGFHSDAAAQIPINDAEKAAAGWGGDRFQVYYHPGLDAAALAAEWVWDTPGDAGQFNRAMQSSLNERFRGAAVDHWAGKCWMVNNQASCFYPKNDRSLWIIAPSLELVDFIMIQYQGYP